LLGDSHTASLKLAWKEIAPEYPDIRMTFFATAGRYADAWEVDSGSLILPDATKESIEGANNYKFGRDRINGDFDRYLLCGLKFSSTQCAPIYESFRIDGSEHDDRTPISADCFHHAVRGTLRGSMAIKTLFKLREITSAPIGIIPQPHRCGDGSETDVLKNSGSMEIVADEFSRAAIQLASELEFDLYPQPENTLSAPLQTNEIYRHKGVHMNTAYGQQVLRAVLAEIPVSPEELEDVQPSDPAVQQPSKIAAALPVAPTPSTPPPWHQRCFKAISALFGRDP
jgi:hypothetical protein